MIHSRPEMNSQPVWQVLYEAAVLEFDPTILLQRVEEAKSAITARLRRMRQVGDSSEDKLLPVHWSNLMKFSVCGWASRKAPKRATGSLPYFR
jgi:hypothetical protein